MVSILTLALEYGYGQRTAVTLAAGQRAAVTVAAIFLKQPFIFLVRHIGSV